MRINHLNILFELICLCVSLFFLTKNRDTFSKLTIWYLALILITEISGSLWTVMYHKNNSWIYNIYSIFEASYICLGFYYLFKKMEAKSTWLIAATYLVFFISYIAETFSHSFFKYHITTTAIMSVGFVVLSLYYYYVLIRQDKTYNLKYYSSFWWVAGVLIYYFGGTIYNLLTYIVIKNNISSLMLVHTMLALNFLLYSIWSYSYICSSRHRKLLPSLH